MDVDVGSEKKKVAGHHSAKAVATGHSTMGPTHFKPQKPTNDTPVKETAEYS